MQSVDELPTMLTIGQAASLLGVHRETLRRWDAQGKLQSVRIGPRGARRYKRQDLIELAPAHDDRVRAAQRLVAEVARTISSSLDLQAVAQTVVDAAARVVGSPRCAIYLIDRTRTVLEPLTAIDLDDPQTVAELFYPNPVPIESLPLARYAMDHPGPLVIDDTETHPLSNPELLRYFNTRTLITIGLRDTERHVFATMVFAWTEQPHRVSADDLFFAETLSALAEVSLSNALMFAQIERERARATVINEVMRGVNSGHDVHDTLTRTITSLVEQLHGDEGAIWLVNKDTSAIVGAVETRMHGLTRIGATLPIADAPNIVRAMTLNEPLLVQLNDALGGEQGWFASLGVQGSLFVPLMSQGHLLGIAFVNYLQHVPHLQADDLQFAASLATQLALAIERAQLLENADRRAAELEAIFDAITDSIIISDRDQQPLQANAASLRILALDDTVPDLRTRIDQFKLQHFDGSPLQLHEAPTERALRGETVTNLDLLIHLPNGAERALLCSSAPIYDTTGTIRAAVTVSRDVTDAIAVRRENVALAGSFQRKAAELEAVISHMSEGVIIADREGQIVLVNPYAAMLHGVAELHVAPGEYSDAYHLFRLDGTPYPSLELPLSRAVLYGETVRSAEWRIHRPDGTEVVASGSASPIIGQTGERLGAVLVVRDVTERRRIETERDHFLSIVSHELRTPLTTIKGLNDLAVRRLTRGVEAPSVVRSLQNVAGQVRRMEALISDLLDVRRLETGTLPLHSQPIDLVPIVVEACERAQTATDRHEVTLENAAVGALTVYADRTRIEQVLDNLLSNAIKYSPHGGLIQLELFCEHDQAVLRVIDHGIGIPSSGRERLFERFYRGANVVDSEYSGLGIGLALSRELVVQHRGALILEKTSPHGSIFRLSLPLITPIT